MVVEKIIRTRYSETDQMGIIYHANYLSWFEIGRTELLRSLSLNYKQLEDENILLPVIDAGCKYITAAKYDDLIKIRTKLVKLKGVRIKYEYEIIREEDDELLAKGYTEHAFVNKQLKPVNFRKKHRELWDKLVELAE